MGFISDDKRAEKQREIHERKERAEETRRAAIVSFCDPQSIQVLVGKIEQAAQRAYGCSHSGFIAEVHVNHPLHEDVVGEAECENALLKALRKREPATKRVTLVQYAANSSSDKPTGVVVTFEPPLM